MPYADIRGPTIHGNPLFVYFLAPVIYLVCSAANLSAWRHFFNFEVDSRYSSTVQVQNMAGPGTCFTGELSDTDWRSRLAMRQGGAARYIGRPQEKLLHRKIVWDKKLTGTSGRPDLIASSSPGPCVWRLATFVAVRHSTYDTSFSCGPSVRQFQRNQIKS